ncbi:6582_t:CDS:10 [Entrophospora sp. SA101]|nr:6582_t:CDS:10 [Entrophospora sp. SA101]CAJ0823943.1 15372_t:CDS:10 [Entrophospora sp. SA101]CAJ0835754.1 13361_t:CDS:10 [Entrophospora sp. SA101]
MVSTTTSDIDTLRNFLNSPGSVDISDLIDALRVIHLSLDDQAQKSQTILETVPLYSFFTLLGSYDENVTSAACNVIEKLMMSMKYSEIISLGLEEYLMLGLQYNSSKVRILSINQIEKCQESEATIQEMINSPLFPLILECIGFDDIPTSTKATEFLVKFRLFDLISQISTSSEESFNLCESSGALDAITSEINSNDFKSGYIFLEKAGILQSFVDTLSRNEDQNVVLTLVKCAVLKFFGKLSEVKEVDFMQVENKYRILTYISSHLFDNNTDIKITAINIIGVIGNNERGLKLLYNNNTTSNIIGNFIEVYQNSTNDVKLTCLQTLSCLFGASENPTPETSDIVERIYRQLEGIPSHLNTLITYAKKNIEELRIATFAVMQKMALHPWGKSEMTTNSKEFIDYILNRTTESTQKAKGWKYSIVQTLVKSSETTTYRIPPNIMERLVKYLNEGPFFVRTEASVALQKILRMH